ncbi:MAG TPA: transposase [Ktedonosporobacter sp.]|nr:transposase [Ktedonosporobacter sp.]
MLLSIDGIQPDKGNETVYLVREVLTGRMLLAEPTRDSETETLKRLFAPVQRLGVPVAGIISDAQTSILCAVASLWPDVPHQVCQFHALRDASKEIFEQDRRTKLAVRQKMQPKLRQYRTDLAKRALSAAEAEQAQYAVLDRYAASAQAAVHLDGLAPFRYGGLEMQEALDALQSSLEQVEKKGARPVTQADNAFIA